MLDALRALAGLRAFRALPLSRRRIVFYAEDHDTSWPHFEPILRELTTRMRRHVCYVTSSTQDPILDSPMPCLSPFYVGSGAVRTYFFLVLKATVVVMTMPDLENFHVKRSKTHPVHYAYVFHALNSTHTAYRRGAFDHFDSVLCAGPHHWREIRATERHYGLKHKALYEHGYGRLDTLIGEAEAKAIEFPANASARTKPLALVAPTWGDAGIFETCGSEVIRSLLDGGMRVLVRPHPMTLRHRAALLEELRSLFDDHPDVEFDDGAASTRSLHAADIMVSDWSGAAIEFSLALCKPVVFIDVPPKLNNPEHGEIRIEALESALREELGRVVSVDRLHELPDVVRNLTRKSTTKNKIAELRKSVVYNPGASGLAGAAIINRLADEHAG